MSKKATPEILDCEYMSESKSFIVSFNDKTKIIGKIETHITQNSGCVFASFIAEVDFEKSRHTIAEIDNVGIYAIRAKNHIETHITQTLVKSIKNNFKL